MPARQWLQHLATVIAIFLSSLPAAAAGELILEVGEVKSGTGYVRNAKLRMPLHDSGLLTFHADRLRVGERHWEEVGLHCPQAIIGAPSLVDCKAATLYSGTTRLPLTFGLDLTAREFKLSLQPEARELWTLHTNWQAGHWQGRLQVTQGELKRFAHLVALPFTVTRGRVAGQADFRGKARNLAEFTGYLQVQDASFSNESGTKAAEALAFAIQFATTQDAKRWNWRLETDWQAGELYWQPYYFPKGGHQLTARGALDAARYTVEEAKLKIAEVGTVEVKTNVHRSDGAVEMLDVAAHDLNLAGAYALLLKPQLMGTMLADLEIGGRANFSASWRDNRTTAFDITLHDFDVEDRRGRFALHKVHAHVPWSRDRPTLTSLRYAGGRLFRVPLGKAELTATLNGFSLTAPALKVALLDGVLSLEDVSAAFFNRQWHGHLSASLSPVSMTELSHALGWPLMQGKLAASVPRVTYSQGRLDMDGAMGIHVFDGSILVHNLVLQNPLGLAPRLNADIRMRDVDLELLTRTFSFGAMTGRLDVDVDNLVLSRWQPESFAASVRSSPGRYPKKISQRAVENISALGGASAAAAIQRSFLRIFKEFSYAEIGLTCRLYNNVCAMDGLAPADGGYVIVRGSGVPAITVLGYNRSVNWGELLTRLKRITGGGTAPVIK